MQKADGKSLKVARTAPVVDVLESRMFLSVAPQIAVAGSGVGIANNDATPSMTDSTDFGPMNVATGSVTRTFKIRDTGAANLKISNITIRGLSAGDYSFVSYPASKVLIGGKTSFTIRYNPSALALAGNSDAKVKIFSNDPVTPTYVYSITGEALNVTTQTDGLQIATTVPGTGTGAVTGDTVYIRYAGYLLDGTFFDGSSLHNDSTYSVTIGTTPVITGWTEGVVGMKAGERRVLIIPPSLGYGPQGSPPKIPPNATLIFVLDRVVPTIWVTDPLGNAIPSGSTTASLANGTAFGSVTVGQSGSLNFLMQTNDLADLRTSASPWIQFSGAGAAAFAAGQASQVATNTVQFTINFNPANPVTSRATVTLYTTATNSPYTFQVKGTGVAAATPAIAAATLAPAIAFADAAANSLLGGTGNDAVL